MLFIQCGKCVCAPAVREGWCSGRSGVDMIMREATQVLRVHRHSGAELGTIEQEAYASMLAHAGVSPCRERPVRRSQGYAHGGRMRP